MTAPVPVTPTEARTRVMNALAVEHYQWPIGTKYGMALVALRSAQAVLAALPAEPAADARLAAVEAALVEDEQRGNLHPEHYGLIASVRAALSGAAPAQTGRCQERRCCCNLGTASRWGDCTYPRWVEAAPAPLPPPTEDDTERVERVPQRADLPVGVSTNTADDYLRGIENTGGNLDDVRRWARIGRQVLAVERAEAAADLDRARAEGRAEGREQIEWVRLFLLDKIAAGPEVPLPPSVFAALVSEWLAALSSGTPSAPEGTPDA